MCLHLWSWGAAEDVFHVAHKRLSIYRVYMKKKQGKRRNQQGLNSGRPGLLESKDQLCLNGKE